MGILAEKKEEVQETVSSEEESQQPTVTPEPKKDISRNPAAEIKKETPVEPLFEPSQIVETVNRTANGNLVNKLDDGVEINITPKVSNEVYSFDIFDENMKIVFTVNAHTGLFKARVPLPKGQYTYFIKTERADMPFSVVFDF